MKLTALKVGLTFGMLLPVMAAAASASSVSYSFSDMADTDVKIGKNAIGYLSFSVSWNDMVAGFSRNSQNPFQANSLNWTLTKAGTTYSSGIFTDTINGPDTGTIVISQTGLAKGEYKLKLNGVWSGTVVGSNENWHVKNEGSVNLGRVGTYSATSPVPEPESYAMFLAGLGLMGTIALRRKKSGSS